MRSPKLNYYSCLGIILLSLFACLLLIPVPSWFWRNSDLLWIADSATVEMNAAIKLPPSTSELKIYSRGFNEFTMWSHFYMNASDYSWFIENASCKETPQKVHAENYDSLSSNLAPGWWQPDKAELLLECYNSRSYILIDMSNPDSYIVYLISGT